MLRDFVSGVRGALAVIVLALWPSSALAQTSPDASSDLAEVQAEVDRDYAQALASDCAMACHALESMRRATGRLCALDPGDRCVQAQQKLRTATERVRSSCPDCAQTLGGGEQTATPAPAAPPEAAKVESAETVQKKGGCAGCATSNAPPDAAAPLALGALLLLGRRRRRTAKAAARGEGHLKPSLSSRDALHARGSRRLDARRESSPDLIE